MLSEKTIIGKVVLNVENMENMKKQMIVSTLLKI